MMNNPKTVTKLPPKFILVSRLSGGLTICLSLIYVLLSITYYVFRYNCNAAAAETNNGAKYFWHTIYRVYILSSSCTDERIMIAKLTDESTIEILVSIAFALAIIFGVVAIGLVIITQDNGLSKYAAYVAYVYIGCFIASLIVDLTTASFLGVDYSYLTSLLRDLSAGSPTNYKVEVIRQGVFWLMTISLKGYVAHFINGVFVILIAVYVVDIRDTVFSEHAIHKLGALSAFDQRRKPEENSWTQSDVYNNPLFMRGPQTNRAFVEDTPPHTPRRPEPQRFDQAPDRSFDRSESWHHTQNSPSQLSARPFSYLEDIKRPVQLKPQVSPDRPVPDSPWRRDMWSQPGPPVPAPDYSPDQPRKLKSALKPAYM